MSENIRSRCNVLLTALMSKDNVERWWNSPNIRFDGETDDADIETLGRKIK